MWLSAILGRIRLDLPQGFAYLDHHTPSPDIQIIGETLVSFLGRQASFIRALLKKCLEARRRLLINEYSSLPVTTSRPGTIINSFP